MQGAQRARLTCGLLALAVLLVAAAIISASPAVHAYGVLNQKNNTTAAGATSVALGFTAGPAANDLLVIICGASTATSITAPTGFSTAKTENTAPSQAIFYKVATGTEGTGTFTCGGGTTSTRWGMQLYAYRYMATSAPLDAVNAVSSSGSGTTANSGSVTTTNGDDVIVAGITSTTSTATSGWTNSFVQEHGMTIGGGTKMSFGGADRIVGATGTYSTAVTVGNAAWRGQIAAFKQLSPVALSSDIVNSSGATVASPSVIMSAASRSFSCQTVTGTLGVSSQKIRVNNTSGNPAWTLSIAATSGATASWSAGTPKYDYNDATGSGCTDGADADSLAGDLTINPAAGTITPQAGCVSTGVTLGTSTAFSEGTTNTITIATGGATASINCYWDLTGIALSQTVPVAQQSGSYSLGLTLTIVAN